jgi:hypothetical protein
MDPLTYTFNNLTSPQKDSLKQLLDILSVQGVFTLTNGSAELHFDDEGLVQEIWIKRKRRRRHGESLTVRPIKNGNVVASFNPDAEIAHITVETKWIRKFALQP